MLFGAGSCFYNVWGEEGQEAPEEGFRKTFPKQVPRIERPARFGVPRRHSSSCLSFSSLPPNDKNFKRLRKHATARTVKKSHSSHSSHFSFHFFHRLYIILDIDFFLSSFFHLYRTSTIVGFTAINWKFYLPPNRHPTIHPTLQSFNRRRIPPPPPSWEK
jgi:hypothetical protein